MNTRLLLSLVACSVSMFGQSLTAVAGTPQSTNINTQFATKLRVLSIDGSGESFPGELITFTAPNSGASGTFPGGLLVVTATTDATGFAETPFFTANGTPGTYIVQASKPNPRGGLITANFLLTNVATPVQVTVNTNPAGPTVSAALLGPAPTVNFLALPGTSHTISTTTPQPFNGGQSQYVFLNWSDGGALSHSITVPNTNVTFTANFKIQHQLTTSVAPAGGGTITPATGFFDQGSVQTVTATPAPGFFFVGFTGSVTSTTNPLAVTMTGPQNIVANFVSYASYLVRYVSHLDKGDGVVNITNTGERGAGLAAGTSASTTGAICANVYAFSPDEQMISCCSCPVTPNGLVSLSARQDLISNTLTPAVPTSIVVKLVATVPQGGSCANSAANLTPGILAPGMLAWGTSAKPAVAGGGVDLVETRFLPATLSIGGPAGIGELARLQQLCNFINANGSGFGICRSCRLGGLGAGRQ